MSIQWGFKTVQKQMGVDRHPGRNEPRVTRSQMEKLRRNPFMNSDPVVLSDDDDDHRHITQSKGTEP